MLPEFPKEAGQIVQQDRVVDAAGIGLFLDGPLGPLVDQNRRIALDDRSNFGISFGSDEFGVCRHGNTALIAGNGRDGCRCCRHKSNQR